MSDPTVSVIIPCFNHARFLPEAIRSILGQSYPQIEIVVVNDGSTDDTSKIATSFGSAVTLVEQENRGLSASRNAGVVASSGCYLQFLDADDVLEPQKVRVHVEHLERNPAVDIVYCESRYFTHGSRNALRRGMMNDEPWMPMVTGAGEPILRSLLLSNIMPVNAPMIRRTLVERVGGFDEDLRAVEDWDYWIRCALEGAFFDACDLQGGRCIVRQLEASMSTDKTRMYKAQIRMRRKFIARLPDANSRFENTRRQLDLLAKLPGSRIAKLREYAAMLLQRDGVSMGYVLREFWS